MSTLKEDLEKMLEEIPCVDLNKYPELKESFDIALTKIQDLINLIDEL